MSFQSTKVIELGSAAFRQWKATHSHCRFLHGYQLKAKFWFVSAELDERNWVFDFGALSELKSELKNLFDHKVVIAQDDPQRELFNKLSEAGVCELTVMESVGCERFAEVALRRANAYVNRLSNGSVECVKCEVYEHADNSAIFQTNLANVKDGSSDVVNDPYTATDSIEVELSHSINEPQEEQTSRAAVVGPNKHEGSLASFFSK